MFWNKNKTSKEEQIRELFSIAKKQISVNEGLKRRIEVLEVVAYKTKNPFKFNIGDEVLVYGEKTKHTILTRDTKWFEECLMYGNHIKYISHFYDVYQPSDKGDGTILSVEEKNVSFKENKE